MVTVRRCALVERVVGSFCRASVRISSDCRRTLEEGRLNVLAGENFYRL